MGEGEWFVQLVFGSKPALSWRYEFTQLRWKARNSQMQSQMLSALSESTMIKAALCRSEASDDEVLSEADVVEGKHLARTSTPSPSSQAAPGM
jgi:hypothetical protein